MRIALPNDNTVESLGLIPSFLDQAYTLVPMVVPSTATDAERIETFVKLIEMAYGQPPVPVKGSITGLDKLMGGESKHPSEFNFIYETDADEPPATPRPLSAMYQEENVYQIEVLQFGDVIAVANMHKDLEMHERFTFYRMD